ncbi:MAG: RNA 2',3'-cyclic phosphodiesterase [Candidatus Cloacimonetes bacterium]|nr:RNA 2',3'-cyclic phosphodiesterase [Candidatus Cloacimonadota bacterium]
MIRTFIAFDIDENTRNECMNLTYKGKSIYHKEINWVEPQNLHFTYLFLGDIVPSDKQSVINLISEVAQKTPILHLKQGQLRWNPPFKPHCLWIEYIISQHNNLNKDGSNFDFSNIRKRFIYDLKQELTYLEFDKRDFKFHLTLGRVKSKEIKSLNIAKWTLNEESIETEIYLQNISLYQSILYPQGPVYKNLATFPLQNNTGGF